MKHLLCLALVLCLTLGISLTVRAAEVYSGDCYCFSQEDFETEPGLAGICITALPETELGSVMLGSRQLRPGDVLTAQQIPELTFLCSQMDQEGTASIRYIPVFANGMSGETAMTLSIRSRMNKAPIAEDSAYETYKNLELNETLKVQEPEGQAMTFRVVRQPRRGNVMIHEDGSFTYTPKKNKVGVDSFTFSATDSAGKESREATVTITILKPCDAKQYSDTVGKSCRFAAEWMKNTGIFVGESLDGNPCFSPDRSVTRGEFVTMLVKTLKEPTREGMQNTGYSDAPLWLQPYLAAAIRSGLTDGLPCQDSFSPDIPISAEDAAILLCNALNLQASDREAMANEDTVSPALSTAAENGLVVAAGDTVTRGEAALMLYQLSQMIGQTKITKVVN